MTCDDVRAALEAFIGGDLSEREGAAVVDHLAACPACSVHHEELSQLVGDLRHARGAVRSLRSFDLAAVPAVRGSRRPRLLYITGILLVAWAVFSTSALIWPSLGGKVEFLRIGESETTTGTTTPAPDRGAPAPSSLANIPTSALEAALESLSSGNRLAQTSTSSLRSAFLPRQDVTVRILQLGPLVRQSTNSLVLLATVSLTSTDDSTAAARQIEVEATMTKSRDGTWTVTRVVPAPSK